MNHSVMQILKTAAANIPSLVEGMNVPAKIPHGDMPGDKILIEDSHIKNTEKILPELINALISAFSSKRTDRCVVSVCGGSGVGKSEIASLIGWYLGRLDVPCYILSGDNYPYRIPKHNDAERMRIFRDSGIKGLLAYGIYTGEMGAQLRKLMENERDADPKLCGAHPWLAVYQAAGKNGLKAYLGTSNEIDFSRLTDIIAQFQNSAQDIMLRRMGRDEVQLWYDFVDFSNISVLIIEWTHSNSDLLSGVDVPILLDSTPQETLAHRRQRGRDGKTDSPFTTLVLEIEQAFLTQQAHKAKIVISKDGKLLSRDILQGEDRCEL